MDTVIANCEYKKIKQSDCDPDSRKQKFTIQITKPAVGSGWCQYKDGELIEETCALPSCNRNSDKYTDFINCLIQDLTDNFVKEFNKAGGPGDCRADRVIRQSMLVYVGKNADLSQCSIDINQKIDLKDKKVCVNINESLAAFQGPARRKFLTKIIDELLNKPNKYLSERPTFVKAIKETLLQQLMNIPTGVETSCSQSIYVTQDMRVFFLGVIKCEACKNGGKCKNKKCPDGSTCGGFTFTQDAIVSAYASCITAPVLDSLSTDFFLKKLYEEDPNANCSYDLVPDSVCDPSTNQQRYKVKMITPVKGKGKCDVSDGQIKLDKCDLAKCTVTEWSNWSRCTDSGFQQRTRSIKTPGSKCPNFVETRACNPQQDWIRKRKVPPMPTPQIELDGKSGGYEWLVYGPTTMTKEQQQLAIICISIFCLLWIYVVFF
jgi:hypothetical protein